MYCTSSGRIPSQSARRMARTWPVLSGAQRLLPRPSAENDMRRITPRMRSPSATALGNVFSTSVTYPSAVTSPVASASNGQDLPSATDWAAENNTSDEPFRYDAPPATAMSMAPCCRARAASIVARSDEAHAASTTRHGPSNPNERAINCGPAAGGPIESAVLAPMVVPLAGPRHHAPRNLLPLPRSEQPERFQVVHAAGDLLRVAGNHDVGRQIAAARVTEVHAGVADGQIEGVVARVARRVVRNSPMVRWAGS